MRTPPPSSAFSFDVPASREPRYACASAICVAWHVARPPNFLLDFWRSRGHASESLRACFASMLMPPPSLAFSFNVPASHDPRYACASTFRVVRRVPPPSKFSWISESPADTPAAFLVALPSIRRAIAVLNIFIQIPASCEPRYASAAINTRLRRYAPPPILFLNFWTSRDPYSLPATHYTTATRIKRVPEFLLHFRGPTHHSTHIELCALLMYSISTLALNPAARPSQPTCVGGAPQIFNYIFGRPADRLACIRIARRSVKIIISTPLHYYSIYSVPATGPMRIGARTRRSISAPDFKFFFRVPATDAAALCAPSTRQHHASTRGAPERKFDSRPSRERPRGAITEPALVAPSTRRAVAPSNILNPDLAFPRARLPFTLPPPLSRHHDAARHQCAARHLFFGFRVPASKLASVLPSRQHFNSRFEIPATAINAPLPS
ncbi:hypothetical protein DFH09DRAFT_1328630 [Mycena vulgaris]|nr:hypothetical protein DFH09DRAFT_1328630 [Mycena vulgaris]